MLRAQATGRWTWGDYLFNRMTRLYIVLMPALVLGGIVDAAGLHFFGLKGIYGGGAGSHTITYAVKDHLSFDTLLGNYAFLQTILVPTLGSNGPLWSLANELWYYIAFPALLFTVLPHVKLPYRIVHFVLLIAVISLMALGPGIALLGLVWLMGVAIHYLPRIPAKGALARRLIVAGATVIFAATLAWSKHTRVEATDYILGIAVTLLIYALLECSRKPMPKAYTTIAQRAAHSSYTLYLTHLPMLVLVAAFFEWKYNIHRWVPDGKVSAIRGRDISCRHALRAGSLVCVREANGQLAGVAQTSPAAARSEIRRTISGSIAMKSAFARARTSPSLFASCASQRCLRSDELTCWPVSRSCVPSGTGLRYSTSMWRVMARMPNWRLALLIASSSSVAMMPPCAWPGGPSNRRASRTRQTMVCSSSTKNLRRRPVRLFWPQPKQRLSAPCESGSSFCGRTRFCAVMRPPKPRRISRDRRFRR